MLAWDWNKCRIQGRATTFFQSFEIFLNLFFFLYLNSQIDYNLPEMLEILEKMLKFDERVVKLKQLRTDHVIEFNELFNKKIKTRIEQFRYESMGQFLNSIDKLVYDIVGKLADRKFIKNIQKEKKI